MDPQSIMTLYQAQDQLFQHGLLLIQNVPKEVSHVDKIASRIGDSFRKRYMVKRFGSSSVANSENLAYTNHSIPLHMDMLYSSTPPDIQYLHCVHFDDMVQGGLNYFTDAVAAAERLRQGHPESFRILCLYPVAFHYNNEKYQFYQERRHIQVDPITGQVKQVY